MENRNRVIGAVILAGAIVFLVYQIKPSVISNGSQTNGINVVGEGKSMITPDTLDINLSVSEVAKTTDLAQKQSNEKITKVQAVLKQFAIDSKNIQTTNASVNPEYDRSKGPQQLSGYRSSQSLHIEMSGSGFEQKGADLIAKISEIGGVNVDNTTFSVKDQSKASQEARDKAFKDAQSKAEQLAKLAGVTLWKVINIVDQTVQTYPGPVYAMAKWASADSVATSPLSAGQTEVSMSVTVNYEIK